MAGSCKTFIVLLVLLSSLCSYKATEGDRVCDDGKYNVEEDLGSNVNWQCTGDFFTTKALYFPAGQGQCNYTHHQYTSVCMQEPIQYQASIPSQGSYRPLPPKFGEYDFLPPQRWLHALKIKGVAFLYHPCTNPEEVEKLRQLASSCLSTFVLTPYPHLTKEKPLAVVTWGCVYEMGWVNPDKVKEWLEDRDVVVGVNLNEQSVLYDRGLKRNGIVKTATFVSLCVEETESTTHHQQQDHHQDVMITTEGERKASPEAAASPCQNNSQQHQLDHSDDVCAKHTLRTLESHQKGLMVLTVLLGIILFCFFTFLVFKALLAWRRRKPKNQRYKSVSRYFPFSYEKQATEVVIPEVGMPREGHAERQVLLNESDEDEL